MVDIEVPLLLETTIWDFSNCVTGGIFRDSWGLAGDYTGGIASSSLKLFRELLVSKYQ